MQNTVLWYFVFVFKEMKRKTKYVGFRLPMEDLEEFDRISDENRTTRSAMLRKCVVERIKKEEKAC